MNVRPHIRKSSGTDSSSYTSSSDSRNPRYESMDATKLTPKGYKWIGERRYHEANPKYLFPSDDNEYERLRRDHFIIRQVLQSDFQAPIRNPLEASIKVLDVGCGAGTWALEMAKEFPESSFFGTDIAQSFPTGSLPKNVVFKQANTLESLPFYDNSFDYVFQRASAFCYTDKEWVKVVNELARVTKPGGWIELVEPEYTVENPGPKMAEYLSKLGMALSVRGININFPSTRLSDLLQAPNFRNITYNQVSAPIGGSTKLGKESLISLELALTSLSPRMCAVMGVRSEELDAMIIELLKEYDELESSLKVHVVYGMKPMGTGLGRNSS